MRHNSIFAGRSALNLPGVWLLLAPLIYFAAQGRPSFMGQPTSELTATYGSLASGSPSGKNIVAVTLIFMLLAMAVFPWIVDVAKECLRNGVFAALALLAFASCIWSQAPAVSLEWSLCLIVNTIFAFYLNSRFNHEVQLTLFLSLGWVCLIASIAMALLVPRYGISIQNGAWQGIYFHKNICAMATVFFLPAAFCASAKSWYRKAVRIVYIALSCGLVIMTQSKTSLIVVVALLVYMLALNLLDKMTSHDRIAVLGGGVIMALTLAGATYYYYRDLVYFMGKDPSLTGRTEIWQAVVTSIMKHPILGYGYMAFWRGYVGESANISLTAGWAVSSAHNGLLGVWVELGAAGLILVVASFLVAFRNALRCVTSGCSQYFKWCACIVFLTIVISIDEQQLLVPNDLRWIMYIVACAGLADGAKQLRVRLGGD